MSCPHSSHPDASPGRCSMCLGAIVKSVRVGCQETVVIDGEEFAIETELTVDGVPTERREPESVYGTVQERRDRRDRRRRRAE